MLGVVQTQTTQASPSPASSDVAKIRECAQFHWLAQALHTTRRRVDKHIIGENNNNATHATKVISSIFWKKWRMSSDVIPPKTLIVYKLVYIDKSTLFGLGIIHSLFVFSPRLLVPRVRTCLFLDGSNESRRSLYLTHSVIDFLLFYDLVYVIREWL